MRPIHIASALPSFPKRSQKTAVVVVMSALLLLGLSPSSPASVMCCAEATDDQIAQGNGTAPLALPPFATSIPLGRLSRNGSGAFVPADDDNETLWDYAGGVDGGAAGDIPIVDGDAALGGRDMVAEDLKNVTIVASNYSAAFELFKTVHGREYPSEEEENRRFLFFVQNMASAFYNQTINPYALYGVNNYSDYHPSEFDVYHKIGSSIADMERQRDEAMNTSPAASTTRDPNAPPTDPPVTLEDGSIIGDRPGDGEDAYDILKNPFGQSFTLYDSQGEYSVLGQGFQWWDQEPMFPSPLENDTVLGGLGNESDPVEEDGTEEDAEGGGAEGLNDDSPESEVDISVITATAATVQPPYKPHHHRTKRPRPRGSPADGEEGEGSDEVSEAARLASANNHHFDAAGGLSPLAQRKAAAATASPRSSIVQGVRALRLLLLGGGTDLTAQSSQSGHDGDDAEWGEIEEAYEAAKEALAAWGKLFWRALPPSNATMATPAPTAAPAAAPPSAAAKDKLRSAFAADPALAKAASTFSTLEEAYLARLKERRALKRGQQQQQQPSTAGTEQTEKTAKKAKKRNSKKSNKKKPSAAAGGPTIPPMDETTVAAIIAQRAAEVRTRGFKPMNIPATFDWRMYGAVTPVRQQGNCGGCWAFATAGNVEGVWRIAGKPMVELSEQSLISCDVYSGNMGCSGGVPQYAYNYIIRYQQGLASRLSSYPFASGASGVGGTCQSEQQVPGAAINRYVSIAQNEDVMAQYVANIGPIAVAVDSASWQSYGGGIITRCLGIAVDHAVLIVGYDDANDPPYWIVKNSWGSDWGERGYVRIAKGSDQCLITRNPSTALAASTINIDDIVAGMTTSAATKPSAEPTPTTTPTTTTASPPPPTTVPIPTTTDDFLGGGATPKPTPAIPNVAPSRLGGGEPVTVTTVVLAALLFLLLSVASPLH